MVHTAKEKNFLKYRSFIKYFKVSTKVSVKWNYNHYNVGFTFNYTTHRYSNAAYQMYQILGVGSITFPDEFTVSYQTYSPYVIEKLIDYCIEMDPSDDLALRYKCLLRTRRHFKNLDDVERIELFAAVDIFNYKRKGLKVLPYGKWMTAARVCRHWLEKKPLEPEIFRRINLRLKVLESDPMYVDHTEN